MKYSFSLVTLALAVLSTSCGGGPRMFPPTVNAAGFSNASLSGGYSFADSGETLVPVGLKFAEAGVLMFDGMGSFKGNAAMNNNGAVCSAIVTGTYSINPDGSGSATVTQTPDAASLAHGCTIVSFPARAEYFRRWFTGTVRRNIVGRAFKWIGTKTIMCS